jgi:hypothetical protein
VTGVSKIFDPVLLEEIIQYNDQGNFDRSLIAAELAIAQALKMDPILGRVGGSADDQELNALFKPNKKKRNCSQNLVDYFEKRKVNYSYNGYY